MPPALKKALRNMKSLELPLSFARTSSNFPVHIGIAALIRSQPGIAAAYLFWTAPILECCPGMAIYNKFKLAAL